MYRWISCYSKSSNRIPRALALGSVQIQTELSNELANKILQFETLGNEFLLLENSLEEEKEANKENEIDIL